MKAKVLIPFRDKHSNKAHNEGDIIDVTLERFKEINTIGNIVEVAETEEEPNETGGKHDEHEDQ